jgi:hypothetical protein
MPLRFKYQELLDEMLASGAKMPELFDISHERAFRFVNSDDASQNHLPGYVRNPRRLIQARENGKLETTNIALSCFPTAMSAEKFYKYLSRVMKHIDQKIGNALSTGYLEKTDGAKTAEDENHHYDLYEYEGCALGSKFNIIKQFTP